MTCGEVLVRYFFKSAIVFGYLIFDVSNYHEDLHESAYTGAVVPPPVTADAKPNGVPVTTEDTARAEILLGKAATRLPKAARAAI